MTADVTRANPRVGLVLAGGGARGAYEIGALSVLAPVLQERGERPGVVLGTSIGAVNAALIAATAHLDAEPAMRLLAEIWMDLRWDQILGPLVSSAPLSRLASYLADLAGVRRAEVSSLLDTRRQAETMSVLLEVEQLARNVATGAVSAAAVVATSYERGDSVVFCDRHGAPPPIPADTRRGIRYAETTLSVDHVRASAAIEALFPAVRIGEPVDFAGWYGDGGTRLNTPIKPALSLGAERIVVIGLNSLRTLPGGFEDRPDVFDGISQMMQALLADPMAHDVQTMATINMALAGRSPSPAASPIPFTQDDAPVYRRVPYIFVAPTDKFAIGRVAVEVWRRHASRLRHRLSERDVGMLGTLVHAGRSPVRGELLSYLFFTGEFHQALLDLGRDDAKRWLDAQHDDGPWRYGPPPTT
jgi:NTE family protein